MKRMTERKGIVFPPYSTCKMCRNYTNEICAERCAPAGDYRGFELREDMTLVKATRFPLTEFMEQMPTKVRQTIVAVYLKLIIDQLQGNENERTYRRPNFNRNRSSQVLEDIQVAALLVNLPEKDTVFESERAQSAD